MINFCLISVKYKMKGKNKKFFYKMSLIKKISVFIHSKTVYI